MSILKRLLRVILRRLGFGTWKINSGETLNFENLLYALLREHELLALIHIGAHDGKSFSDPLYHFVIKNHESIVGVYIEPVSSTFERLKLNLGHIKSLSLLKVAVHPKEKSVEIFTGVAVPGSDWDASGRSTLYKSRLDTKPNGISTATTTSERVTALSIQECLSHLPSGSADLPLVMCVDAEGLDFEIIRSIYNTEIRPWLLRFEHNLCLTSPGTTLDDYLSLVSELNELGYQVFTEHNDSTAIHTRLIKCITRTLA